MSASGGTLGRAPLGYLNVTDNVDGRRINTVAVDPERAPFVRLAFELYGRGQATFQDVADELTDRGLVTRATARRPAGPVSDSKIHQMLRDRYYLGEVRYKGEYFEGRHEALSTPSSSTESRNSSTPAAMPANAAGSTTTTSRARSGADGAASRPTPTVA